jgi:hypothetical protein
MGEMLVQIIDRLWILWTLRILIFSTIFLSGCQTASKTQREQLCTRNGHNIAMAIGRFHNDYGVVPQDVDQLVALGYLSCVPLNPYTGKPMRNVRLDTRLSPGDYSYFTGIQDHYVSGHYTGRLRSAYLLYVFADTPVIQPDTSRNTSRYNTITDKCKSVVYASGDIMPSGSPEPKWSQPGYRLVTQSVEEIFNENGYK